jgi:hypothetical protein
MLYFIQAKMNVGYNKESDYVYDGKDPYSFVEVT